MVYNRSEKNLSGSSRSLLIHPHALPLFLSHSLSKRNLPLLSPSPSPSPSRNRSRGACLLAAGLDAIDLDVLVADEGVEQADGVGASAHARHDGVGKPPRLHIMNLSM
jgi:hypothetical protein